MNTERPDNGETSGGGDGSAEEQRGAEARAATPSSAEESHAGGAEGSTERTEPTEQAEAATGGEAETDADASADAEVSEADASDGDAPDAGTTTDADAETVIGTDDSTDSGTTSAAAADAAATAVEGPDVTPAPDAPRSGRPRSPLAVAAVAAAVLLVGGGGALVAAHTSGGSGEGAASGPATGGGTPPPLALDGYSASEGGGNGIAPGEPNPYGATYRVDGALPAGPGSAPVYLAQGRVTEADVARLAEALGVDGTPVAQGEVWRIGGKDGSGPSLQVNRRAPGAWSFQRYSPVIDDCRSETVCGAPETPTGDPVSVAVAEKAAAPVLKAVGQGTAKLDASQVMGAQRVVNADPVVGGLPTYGWSTGITVNAEGEVVGGSGQLKAPVKSDTYPVLSAEKTLGLMNKAPVADHRMGIGGCASPVPLKDRLEEPCGQSTGSPASPAGDTLTVEKAVFGLASHTVGGRSALVPSWLFRTRAAGAADAFTVTYPAVDPRYITAAATPTPVSPTAPSDRPTSAPKTRDVKVDGYTAEGDELTVSFTGGVCADYSAAARESAGEVEVTVTAKPWQDKVCIMIAKEMQKTVTLDEPLGDRQVVGSDGSGIPLSKPGARLPETSGAR